MGSGRRRTEVRRPGLPRAHGERSAQVRPACTFLDVSHFIDPAWLVEFEVDAIVA
jgi:hypothetical protein